MLVQSSREKHAKYSTIRVHFYSFSHHDDNRWPTIRVDVCVDSPAVITRNKFINNARIRFSQGVSTYCRKK